MNRWILSLLLLLCLSGPSWAQEDLDGDWSSYIEATADAPSGSVTGFTYIVQIDSTNAGWWAVVQSDGDDIRATVDGVQAAVDVIEFDAGADQALIAVIDAGAQSDAATIRIYAGNPTATLPADTDTYGRENAYSANLRAFYPNGGGTDRTQYDNDLTMSGGPTVGGATGPITGSKATDYDATDDKGVASASVPTVVGANGLSFLASGNMDNATLDHAAIGCYNNASATYNNFALLFSGNVALDALRSITSASGQFPAATSNPGYTVGTYCRGCAIIIAVADRKVAINGTLSASQTGSATPTGINRIVTGSFENTSSGSFFDGRMAFAQVWDVALSAAWISHDAAMLANGDQSAFYNGWTFEGAEPPTIDTDANQSVDEGATNVVTMTATGDAPITWQVWAGPDAGLFTIDENTGTLIFAEEPNVDGGEPSRQYAVTIRATNAAGTDDLNMTITVYDTPPNIFTNWTDWVTWKDARITWIEGHCPSARTTSYFFANQGNDTTGDGTIGNPWATRAKAITMTAANTRLRFECGDIFEGNANWAITVDDVTVDSYGVGAKPLFDAFDQNYLESSNLWTNASGNRWTMAETDDIGWLRLTADPLGNIQGTNLIRVASSGACESTTNSWFWGSNVLHVNLGVFSPNDVDLEAVISNGNNGVEFQGDGCRLEGIAAHGFGLHRTDSATQDQPFTNRSDGTEANYFKNFEAYYSGSHVVAHNAPGSGTKGGVSVWNTGLVGYPKYNSVGENTLNSFSNNGEAETWFVSVDSTHGCLKSSDWDYATEGARGSVLLSHTATADVNHLMVAFDCDLLDSHTPANVLSSLGGTRDAAGDYTQVRAFLVNCTVESLGQATKQFPSINFFPNDTIVYGCNYNLWPTQVSPGAFNTINTEDCWVGNTLIKVTGSDINDWGFANISSGTYAIHLWHCGIWEEGSTGAFAFDYDNKFGFNAPGAGPAQDSSAVNTIFSFDSASYLGLVNELFDGTTGITNNMYWNVTADVGDERGHDADANGITLSAKPNTTSAPPGAKGAGSGAIPTFSHDYYGNPRTTLDIGPFAAGSGGIFGENSIFGGWVR